MELINIKEYTKTLKEDLKKQITNFLTEPTLAIVQIGENEASNRYVRNKIKDCEEVGIVGSVYFFPEDITQEEAEEEVRALCDFYDALIIQLPLPQHLDPKSLGNIIPAKKDVDGFRMDSLYVPATPKGIMDYLKKCGFEFEGKEVVIIGRSEIVGKPLAKLMTDANATVTLCHSKSCLTNHVHCADLIISAVGKPNFLNCYSLYMPIIDVGINFNEKGKMVGDCYNTDGRNVTPVPGGVGLLTRCALLENVVLAKKETLKNEC